MADSIEITVAEMRRDIKQLDNKLSEQSEISKEILVSLKGGNNVTGLTTRVCLLKQSVRRAWYWLGMLSIAILGIAIHAIKKNLN